MSLQDKIINCLQQHFNETLRLIFVSNPSDYGLFLTKFVKQISIKTYHATSKSL